MPAGLRRNENRRVVVERKDTGCVVFGICCRGNLYDVRTMINAFFDYGLEGFDGIGAVEIMK